MPGQFAQLELEFAPVVIPRADGSYLIRPGKPIIKAAEISAEQAAKIIGCSVWSVYRYIRDGDLTQARQIKHRGRIRLNRHEVEALAGKAHPSLL